MLVKKGHTFRFLDTALEFPKWQASLLFKIVSPPGENQ